MCGRGSGDGAGPNGKAPCFPWSSAARIAARRSCTSLSWSVATRRSTDGPIPTPREEQTRGGPADPLPHAASDPQKPLDSQPKQFRPPRLGPAGTGSVYDGCCLEATRRRPRVEKCDRQARQERQEEKKKKGELRVENESNPRRRVPLNPSSLHFLLLAFSWRSWRSYSFANTKKLTAPPTRRRGEALSPGRLVPPRTLPDVVRAA